jgi:geranylgeranyl diphosphate synthase type II
LDSTTDDTGSQATSDPQIRIQQALDRAILLGSQGDCPPGLENAVRDAVFPGGSRLRPKLCLAVAEACGDDQPRVTEAAAASLELLHCASLVHDDMPCFDDAEIRRGRPSIQAAYGEPTALLCGDSLIVLAFEHLATELACAPERLAPLVRLCSSSVGMARGLCAGQAWECEDEIDLSAYHRAKTGVLFSAATTAGALAAGANPRGWRRMGELLGEAYQVADDLRDVVATVAEVGGRQALKRLEDLVCQALSSIPDCPGAAALTDLVAAQAASFLPPQLVQRVA